MLKVVVIDDSAISRNLLTTILVNGGHDVIGDANTSSAGVARMLKLQPQIVCIDIGDADNEAMATLDTIREALPKAVMFMVSSKFHADMVQSAAQRGVHGFIVKPFNAVTVLNTIRNSVLKLARAHRDKPGD